MSEIIPSAFALPADKPPRLPSPEEALAQSERTGERVQARDGRWYSHADLAKRMERGRIDAICDFSASLTAAVADPREVLDLCRDPDTRNRVKTHAEAAAEALWRLVGHLEAQ